MFNATFLLDRSFLKQNCRFNVVHSPCHYVTYAKHNTKIPKFVFLLLTREVSYVEILSVKNDRDILQHLHVQTTYIFPF